MGSNSWQGTLSARWPWPRRYIYLPWSEPHILIPVLLPHHLHRYLDTLYVPVLHSGQRWLMPRYDHSDPYQPSHNPRQPSQHTAYPNKLSCTMPRLHVMPQLCRCWCNRSPFCTLCTMPHQHQSIGYYYTLRNWMMCHHSSQYVLP